MRVVAIIQARCGSTRFPNKVFADLCGKPFIWHVVNRLKFVHLLDHIVLATTDRPSDDKLYYWAKENGVDVYRGSESNVLNRYYEAANYAKADIIVRITADDPFKEPGLIDKAINTLQEGGYDFVCNNCPPSYPEGLDIEVFTKAALDKEEELSTSNFEREHVTQYIYHHPEKFKMFNISNIGENLSYLRWTVDTKKDFQMVARIYSFLYKNDSEIFYMNDILLLLKGHPEIEMMNSDVTRSEMYKSI
ncbi:glycosyltransferase family protein [Bacteroides eggerthii]|uniref:cytidylyltransferase domain-containing protein n=1 Tax=Bacteroidaceae TaxID=815 RepID=UPI00095CF9DF|nr:MULTISPECIES: glycosyltransferase family protein [Bacteroides]MBV3842676.1 glycosyltransferase family protein [Bacteroides eggerthii]MBV3845595.1 glycosyltransferase family protein [Bacteroides eggerthii]MBV3883773.1 glycosyltransferase family protein [Bacteroides eggerthii]MBV3890720.1 glycosyltransferase family protein [Bacteroides eggerthii]MBV3901881.1 glycosyltransferase family protein [Bacteroides eggerthii]